MKARIFSTMAALAAVLFAAGCGKVDLKPVSGVQAMGIEQTLPSPLGRMSAAQQSRILSLNPEHVTDSDVRNVLAGAPAPRIINIHGGIATVDRKSVV